MKITNELLCFAAFALCCICFSIYLNGDINEVSIGVITGNSQINQGNVESINIDKNDESNDTSFLVWMPAMVGLGTFILDLIKVCRNKNANN